MNFKLKLILINLLDALLLNGAILAALALRFDGDVPRQYLHAYARGAVPFTGALLVLMNLSGVNRALWRYAGVPTLLLLVRTLSVGFGAAFVLDLIPQVRLVPMSVVIMAWVLATGLILTSRLFWKMVRRPSWRSPRADTGRVLIVGAGDVGAMLARELERQDHRLGQPVGFVDDDPSKRGRRVETLPVLGTTFDIPRLIVERKVSQVLIAAPSAPSRLIRQVVQICQDAGVECKTVPALTDFIAGKGALGQIREVQIEDLLGREPVAIDLEGISGRVGGRTVLVTGAGGSIGSELCRQLARFRPERLVALDHCENRLCYLGLDMAESHPELEVIQVVGDIRDEVGIGDLLRRYRPDLVFHAAAHKHVNLLETVPREAVLNNVLGTRNLARASIASGVETFVFISTDKAVNPSNVMGASKRACEILIQAFARESATTTFVAVRFGNVLGSDGSVIPIFRRQLARGGPLTVTHPDVRRYFMTIPEASQLVIQAALFGTSGDVFVLDMGEQVRILDVAEQLIRLSGLRPGLDVPIRFVGLRPGEKLEEELLTDTERTRVTQHKKIFRMELDPVDPEWVAQQLRIMERLGPAGTPEEIRGALAGFVPEYQRRAVTPLPPPETIPLPLARPAAWALPAGHWVEPRGKRLADLVIALPLLAALLPATFLLLLLYRLTGPGEVRFVAEERIGRNHRRGNRRVREGKVPIDRRFSDRRSRPLPGRPFLCYRMILVRHRRHGVQSALAHALRRSRLDRALTLWNVLRGDMSLVGPTARLARETEIRQDWTTAWIFARRPGLTGPGAIFGARESDGGHRTDLYDGYYSRFGGARLDLDSLLYAVSRVFREEGPAEEDIEPQPAGLTAASRQEG